MWYVRKSGVRSGVFGWGISTMVRDWEVTTDYGIPLEAPARRAFTDGMYGAPLQFITTGTTAPTVSILGEGFDRKLLDSVLEDIKGGSSVDAKQDEDFRLLASEDPGGEESRNGPGGGSQEKTIEDRPPTKVVPHMIGSDPKDQAVNRSTLERSQ